ncbi:hypothetical protein F4777DRAFT_555824 [Nemania sp. FL0916]|nr:hypothetical protein F4777DRAFT_555824 [Nemania sp. FL0916]
MYCLNLLLFLSLPTWGGSPPSPPSPPPAAQGHTVPPSPSSLPVERCLTNLFSLTIYPVANHCIREYLHAPTHHPPLPLTSLQYPCLQRVKGR